MLTFTAELEGRRKMAAIFSRFKRSVNDLSPAFNKIADNFREIEKETFDKRGRPRKWRPLSPAYAKWKRKNHPGKPIMVLTGNLRESLINRGGDHIVRIKRQSMEIGTRDPKGEWHQKGRGNLRIRKLISPKASDMTGWIGIIRSHIMNMLGLRGVK